MSRRRLILPDEPHCPMDEAERLLSENEDTLSPGPNVRYEFDTGAGTDGLWLERKAILEDREGFWHGEVSDTTRVTYNPITKKYSISQKREYCKGTFANSDRFCSYVKGSANTKGSFNGGTGFAIKANEYSGHVGIQKAPKKPTDRIKVDQSVKGTTSGKISINWLKFLGLEIGGSKKKKSGKTRLQEP